MHIDIHYVYIHTISNVCRKNRNILSFETGGVVDSREVRAAKSDSFSNAPERNRAKQTKKGMSYKKNYIQFGKTICVDNYQAGLGASFSSGSGCILSPVITVAVSQV